MDSGNIAELEELDCQEAEDLADLTATETEKPNTMDFHVQMNGYTMADFENMVVNAAARQLLGGRTFQADIKEKVNEIASSKLNDRLTAELKDLMNITVMKRGSEDISLRQMIGMEAKDYLTETVNSNGKTTTDSWERRNGLTRLQWIASNVFREAFKKELEQAFKDLRTELASAIQNKIKTAIDEQRKQVADALGFELTRLR